MGLPSKSQAFILRGHRKYLNCPKGFGQKSPITGNDS